jgi:SAM-dependent methyltransferase
MALVGSLNTVLTYMTEKPFEYPDHDYNTRSAEQVLPLILSKYHPRSILDVGCGNGSWLRVAEKMGIYDLKGIDAQEQKPGSWLLEKGIFSVVNLAQPFELNRKFDLIICLEVAEHLPETAASVFIDSLVNHADLIIFSAAIPGQGGDRHLNEKKPSYWQFFFNQRGFNTYDEIRPLIWENEQVLWWYRQNIFLAERKTTSNRHQSMPIPWIIHPGLYQEKENRIADLEKILQDQQHRNRSFIFNIKQAIKSLFQK